MDVYTNCVAPRYFILHIQSLKKTIWGKGKVRIFQVLLNSTDLKPNTRIKWMWYLQMLFLQNLDEGLKKITAKYILYI